VTAVGTQQALDTHTTPGHTGSQALSGAAPLSLRTSRVNLMRAGYLLMAVGLAVTRWPRLGEAASLPVYEGVVTALLTAMSVLALVGLRYPVQMLPILLFESLWKVIWLGIVAIPVLATGEMNAETNRILSSVALVVVILAVTPWDFVWKRYVRAPGDSWR
jgi:hypothetical protein